MSAPWSALVARRSSGRLAVIDPRVKLAWLAAFLGLSVVLGRPASLLALALGLALTVALGGVGREILSALRAMVAFIVMVSALDVAYFGLLAGLLAGLKFALAIASFALFLRTTPLEELALALVRLGFPDSFAFTLATGARFVPTVAAEAGEILDAYRARGVPFEGTVVGRIRVYARVLVPLVVSTVSRSIRLAEAMEARAFSYAPRRTPLRDLRLLQRDWLALGLAVSFAALLVAVERL